MAPGRLVRAHLEAKPEAKGEAWSKATPQL